MREYGRIPSSFWTQLRGATDGEKLLAAYLLSCSHSNAIGAFLLPDAYIADDLGWALERVYETLSELSSKGFAKRFADGRHIMLCGYISVNKPENPNVVKAMIKQFERLPADPLLQQISNDILTVGEWVPKEFREGCERVSSTLPKASQTSFRNPEPYPKPDPKPYPEPKPDARSLAGVREAPAPLTRVELRSLVTAAPDWAETCGDDRWIAAKHEDCSARDWEMYLAHCRPNGSPTTLICPSEGTRKIIEHRFGAKLAARFGEPITFKVETSRKEATT